MGQTPQKLPIPVKKLQVDTKNPRLPEMQSGQDDAIRLMVGTQTSKILALAQHLAEHGTNPASLPIVIPDADKKGSYYVLDGNRRLTALRLLERPGLAEGILDDATSRRLQDLSATYRQSRIGEFDCVVFRDRDEADPWIRLIHRGESRGAGLVEWDGHVAARYDERRGIGGKGTIAALQILESLGADRALSDKTRQRIGSGTFPITSLTRLINTPYVRKKIGLTIGDGDGGMEQGKTKRSLLRIIEDLGSEYITVSDIKRVDQRIDYIDRLLEPRPDRGHKQSAEMSASADQPSRDVPRKKTATREARARTTIIPRDYAADVTQARTNKIFRELKKLDVDEFPNAGAVMLRVFLELSLDSYLQSKLRWPEIQIDNSTLAQKLSAVANDLENKKLMTAKQLAPIRKAAGGQTLLAASIKTLHAYVHNRYFSPIASELRTAWDDLADFVLNIWTI